MCSVFENVVLLPLSRQGFRLQVCCDPGVATDQPFTWSTQLVEKAWQQRHRQKRAFKEGADHLQHGMFHNQRQVQTCQRRTPTSKCGPVWTFRPAESTLHMDRPGARSARTVSAANQEQELPLARSISSFSSFDRFRQHVRSDCQSTLEQESTNASTKEHAAPSLEVSQSATTQSSFCLVCGCCDFGFVEGC